MVAAAERQLALGQEKEWFARNIKNGIVELSLFFLPILSFGPSYYVSTSQGESLRIRMLFSEGPFLGKKRKEDIDRKFFCLAENSKGEIVGVRYTEIYIENGQILVGGGIFVIDQNKGIATAIELVEMDILQREANARGKNITEIAVDANGKQLADDIFKAYHAPDDKKDFYREVIAMRRMQHERWFSLWGANGKLGFIARDQESTQKVYKPQYSYPSANQFDKMGDIFLSRRDYRQDGRNLILAEVAEPFFDCSKDTLGQRKEYFQKTLLPKMEEIASTLPGEPAVVLGKNL